MISVDASTGAEHALHEETPMPQTLSEPITIGTPAADFALPDANGHIHRLADFADRPALLVAFISNRCPSVLHIREAFSAFASQYAPRGLQVVAINSNDADAHPEETLERVGEEVTRAGYVFPYLKDEDQSVAQAYNAACTPDLFLFDADRKLAYHGQFDSARPKNGKPIDGADLRAAVDAVLAGQAPSGEQTPSVGCNIKWRAGNEPAYFTGAPAAAA
jgi:peroxiredoxin